MAFYSYIFSANTKRFKTNLKKIAKRDNKSYHLLLLDTYFSILRYGIGLTDYLNFEFHKKNRKERLTYAGIKAQNKFYETVSPSKYKKRYTIKPDFLEDFKEYTKRDFVVPERVDFKTFKKFVDNHDMWMSKPYDGLGGTDVEKVYKKDIKDINKYYEDCKEKQIFLEEVVKQHKKMNELCPTSCNTIRIMTFNNHGKSEILAAVLRIGNGVNAVDNFHAGGMTSEIDIKTGKLINNALTKDLVEHEVHPVTKVKFVGFEIPYWEELKKMVLKAALESDKILVVGWDVAIAQDGPLIIEGNRRPGFDVIQVAGRRGRKDIMTHVYNELNKSNR